MIKHDIKLWQIDYESKLSEEDIEFWDKFDNDYELPLTKLQ